MDDEQLWLVTKILYNAVVSYDSVFKGRENAFPNAGCLQRDYPRILFEAGLFTGQRDLIQKAISLDKSLKPQAQTTVDFLNFSGKELLVGDITFRKEEDHLRWQFWRTSCLALLRESFFPRYQDSIIQPKIDGTEAVIFMNRENTSSTGGIEIHMKRTREQFPYKVLARHQNSSDSPYRWGYKVRFRTPLPRDTIELLVQD